MTLGVLAFPADKRIAGIGCAFFTLFAVLQTAGALLAPAPAGPGVQVPFIVYCAEIFLAAALGAAYLVDLAMPASASRTVLASALWVLWFVMAAGVYAGLPRLAILLDRYEYGASLGIISAAPGMTAGQIARGSSLTPSHGSSNERFRYSAPLGRIFTFRIAGTATAFDHTSSFEAAVGGRNVVRSIHVTIVPGAPEADASAAALDRAETLLRSTGWNAAASPGSFSRSNLRIRLTRRIVGHTNIDDPASPAEYGVFADLTGS